ADYGWRGAGVRAGPAPLQRGVAAAADRPGNGVMLFAGPARLLAAEAAPTAGGSGRRSEPADAVHHAQATGTADDVGQVGPVADPEREADHGDVGVALEVFDAFDVGFGLGDRRRHLGQRTGLVLGLDDQRHVVLADHLAVPADGHPAVGRLAVVGDVGAVHPVHHDALAGGVVTHDLVAGDRHAAVGEADHAALVAGDQDPFATASHRLGPGVAGHRRLLRQ